MSEEYVLAVDIGGTSIKIGVVLLDKVIESTSIRNTFKGKPETLIDGIKDLCNPLISKYNISKIGVGCPGDIVNGVVVYASNLGWRNFDLLNAFKQEYQDFDIAVANDGQAASNAEVTYGELKGVEKGLFITIGRGIGGAIILGHQILNNVYNIEGRFGHMVIHTKGRKCNCGRRGCFETYASVLGLIQTAKDENSKCKEEDQKIETDKLSGYQIVQYKKQGNKVAIEAVRKWNNSIAEGILNLCNIFDPSVVVIAGGITESDLISLYYIKQFLSNHDHENCEVKLAKFKSKTGMIGAASLVNK